MLEAHNDLLHLALALACGRRAPPVVAWLHRCAGIPEGSPLPPIPAGFEDDERAVDVVLEQMWRSRPREERTLLGQVFTPRPVARQVLLEAGVRPEGRVVDPACGGGIFLVEAAAQLRQTLVADGVAPERIARAVIDHVVGVDVDTAACRLARLLVGLEAARALDGLDDLSVLDQLPEPHVLQADATDPLTQERLLQLEPRWVVGNPPYLEAKRMPKDLRRRLRERYGHRLEGAFDYYMVFVWLALELVGEGGRVGLVLPNKVQVARYAASLRAHLVLTEQLVALIDLSELDVFKQVGVYPVIVILGPSPGSFRACFRQPALDELGQAPLGGATVSLELVRALMEPPVWFTLPDGALPGLLARLVAQLPRLEEVAQVRSTCSFHKRGLREQYIHPGPQLPDGLPYLGGQSYARRNEVRPYQVDWQGFRIHYAAEELRSRGNSLPPLEIFTRPKIVICQHARSLVAWCDVEGRFVTKDVFPVVLPHVDTACAAAAWTAVLNSRVVSVIYHLLFRGIQIGGGYLHFLPVYLHRLPVPPAEAVIVLGPAVLALQQDPTPGAAEALDREVSALYGLQPDELEVVEAYADAVLGFSSPLQRR